MHLPLLQVEQELAAERVAAEAEAKRAQEAIQAKQQELQQIEQQRQHEANHQPISLALRHTVQACCVLHMGIPSLFGWNCCKSACHFL